MTMKNRLFFTEKYLQKRPAFFSLIRPIEADLIYKNKKLLGKKILDFGCGDGFFADLIFQSKEISVGLDVFQSRIDEALDKKAYKSIKKYDGVKIPYSNATFDGVFSNSVLEHTPDLKGNVREIARIIKKNGYFLTTVMTQNWEKHLIGGKIFGELYRSWLRRNQEHLNLLTPQEWAKAFEKEGFVVEKSVGYLNQKTSGILEIWHYLSTPSLLSSFFFKHWVLWKNWYLFLSLHKVFEGINKKSFVNTRNAASIFFILKKKK